MSCLNFGPKKLREHQIRVIKHLFNNFSILAAHGTGTGKTLTAVASAECLLFRKNVTHVIVATPRALIDNFWKELLIYSDFIDVEKYTVRTYQGVQKLFLQNPNFFENAFLIIDEVHNLRTEIDGPKGKMAHNFIKMARKVNRVLILTATPVINRISEFSNLYHILLGDGKKEGFVHFLQTLNVDENICPRPLRHFTKLVDVHQRMKSDENFPKVTRKDEIFIMSGEYYKKYLENEKLIINARTDLTFFMQLRQLMNKTGDDDTYKIAFVLDKLLYNKQHKLKTVVFSQFLTNGLQLITDYLDKKGISYYLITGKTKKKDIKDAIENFNKMKRGGILFISKAGGEGLDLKGVREMILMEPFWNDAAETQAIGRGVRYKSHSQLPPKERNVKIFRLILRKPQGRWWHILAVKKNSVDQYLVMKAKMKQEEINKFMDCLS